MHVVFDRPSDQQVWERATPVAGWIEGIDEPGRLSARVGDVVLPVAACLHPRAVGRGDLHGFWTEIVLQNHLAVVRDGLLAVELRRDERTIARMQLQVAPLAAELARSHPLDLAEYTVPAAPETVDHTPPTTLVFPGLGAVGGSSLNHLMRRQTLHRGAATTIYGEADAPALWARIQPERRGYRWIDGHGCWAAGDLLGGRAARITLLREPIRRLVSAYNYGVLVHPELFPADGFDAFVAAGGARRHSQAVGLVQMAEAGVTPPTSDRELLAAARNALTRGYALVGIAERFEETIFLLCRLVGWDTIGLWWRVLAAPRLVDPDTLAPATRHRLDRDLAADVALYEDARAAFDARVAAAAFGPALARYRDAAAAQRELSPAAKAVECLRWRQVLATFAAGAAA